MRGDMKWQTWDSTFFVIRLVPCDLSGWLRTAGDGVW